MTGEAVTGDAMMEEAVTGEAAVVDEAHELVEEGYCYGF